MKPDINGMKAHAKKYGAGTLAYIDSFGGMVKCRVIEVLKEGYGFLLGDGPHIKVEVLETKAGYTKGEKLDRIAMHTPPVQQRFLRGYQYRVNTLYQYAA